MRLKKKKNSTDQESDFWEFESGPASSLQTNKQKA